MTKDYSNEVLVAYGTNSYAMSPSFDLKLHGNALYAIKIITDPEVGDLVVSKRVRNTHTSLEASLKIIRKVLRTAGIKAKLVDAYTDGLEHGATMVLQSPLPLQLELNAKRIGVIIDLPMGSKVLGLS